MKKYLFFIVLIFTLNLIQGFNILYCKSAEKVQKSSSAELIPHYKADKSTTTSVKTSTAVFVADEFEDIEKPDEEGVPVQEATKDEEGEDITSKLSAEPLNLNAVTATELLNLPGMTPILARNILKQRRKQPFFDVDELKDVSGMKPEIFEQIKPYVMVKAVDVKAGDVLKGDMRLRCKATRPVSSTPDNYYNNNDPSKPDYYGHYHEPFYFYNRTRIRYGHKHELGFLAYKRDQEPPLTLESFREYNLKKFWFRMNNTFGFTKIIFGNYLLQLNQGLAFYDNLNESGRPIKVKGKGLREDKSTNPNQHLAGCALERRFGQFETLFFLSDKFLDAPIKPDGTAEAYFLLWREYDGGGYVRTTDQRRQNRTIREKLFGGYTKYYIPFIPSTNISALAYKAEYNPKLNADKPETGTYTFKGDEIAVYDFGFDTYFQNLNFFGEWARSDAPRNEGRSQSGQSWLLQAVSKIPPITLWSGYYDYARNYYNRFGKAKVSTISSGIEVDYGLSEVRSQKGFFAGFEYKKRAHTITLTGTVFNMPAYRPLSTYSTSTRPMGPFDGLDAYLNYKYKIFRNLELEVRELEIYSKARATPEGGVFPDDSHDYPKVLRKTRLQMKWDATKSTRYTVRYEQRRKELEEINETTLGKMIFGDVKHKLTPNLTLNTRIIFFDAPDEYVTQSEPYWKNVLVTWTTSMMRNPSKGSRYYVQLDQKLSKKASIWFKYEHTIIDVDGYGNEKYGKRDHGFKLQYDLKW